MAVDSTQPVYPPQTLTPITSVWGQAVSDSVVQKFASVADRTAKWVNPPVGSLSTIIGTGTIDVFRAGAWRPMSERLDNDASSANFATNQPLPASTWQYFEVGPNFVTERTGLYLIIVNAVVGCVAGFVYLNFAIDNNTNIMPTSAQGECKNGEGINLTAVTTTVIPAGNHVLRVAGHAIGASGYIGSINTNVIRLYTS
jgi:hypothetical protein